MTLGEHEQHDQCDEWHVYILRCADNSLYTGITKEIARRINEHNESSLGAKYTRARRPVTLAYSETVASHSLAAKREAQIKKLNRQQKLELIHTAACNVAGLINKKRCE